MDATRDLIACGVLQTERLITHHFPVTHAAEAFDMVLARRQPFLGVILDWTSSA
jgi:threonine dehydrogenase-like Zn-dependent dehydrogenase